MKSRLSIVLVLCALLLVACGTPAASPAALTAPPGAQVQPPAGATTAPKRGGKVVMAMWQSPTTLNYYLGSQTVVNEVVMFVAEGFTDVMPDGSRVPWLAKEVPTLQNGGVSADGKTITYKLKEGVVFSNGDPLTCDDVKYTWQAILTPGVGVSSTAGYSDIEDITCPDPLTVAVKFKNVYAPFLTLFDRAILPKSTGDPKDMKNWAYNRKPIGTGPFKVDEWVADDHVTLSRNEKFREKDKPVLDQIVIRITPSSDVTMQLIASGEVDIMWNNTEADIPQLEKLASQGVKTVLAPGAGSERLFLNLAENKDPSDPTKPHPILSDVRVRQAISYGINRQQIIDKLLFGKATPSSNELVAGAFTCDDIKPYATDPEKAKKLLDDAGWKPGTDGIRVKDGQRLRLKFMTTSGNKLREDSQVLMLENMKAIGMEWYIENAPSSVVIGTWDSGAPQRHGNFDIIMYTYFTNVDPHSIMFQLFASSAIPTEKNKNGTNMTRFNDAKADDLLAKAATEPDTTKRKSYYCQIAQMSYDQVNMVYLYRRASINSYRDRIVNGQVAGNIRRNLGWDAKNWAVKSSN